MGNGRTALDQSAKEMKRSGGRKGTTALDAAARGEWTPPEEKRKAQTKAVQKFNPINVGTQVMFQTAAKMAQAKQTKQKPNAQNLAERRGQEIKEKNGDNPKNALQRAGYVAKGNAKQYGSGMIRSLTDAAATANKAIKIDPKLQEDWKKRNAHTERTALVDKLTEVQGDNETYQQNLRKKAIGMYLSGSRDVEKAKSGLSELEKAGIDTAGGVGQWAADMVIGLATGGSALVPMAFRSYGGGAMEAELEGANEKQQALYGLGSAGREVGSELLFAGLPIGKILGKGVTGDAVEHVASSIASKIAKTPSAQLAFTKVLQGIINAGGEGVEELISDLVDPFLKDAIYTDDQVAQMKTPEFWKQALYDFAIGAAVSGAIGGPAAVANHVQTSNQGKAVRGNNLTDALMEQAKKSPEGSFNRALAEDMEAREEAGKRLTNYKLGTLLSESAKEPTFAAAISDNPIAREAQTLKSTLSESGMEQSDVSQTMHVVERALAGEKLGNREVKRLVQAPAAVSFVEEKTGLSLDGTMKEKRAALADYSQSVKSGATEPISIAPDMNMDHVLFRLADQEIKGNQAQDLSEVGSPAESAAGNVAQGTNMQGGMVQRSTMQEQHASFQTAEEQKVADAIQPYGEHGTKAFRALRSKVENFDAYQIGFSTYYREGRAGIPLEKVNESASAIASLIPENVRKAAYFAGENDRLALREQRAADQNTENANQKTENKESGTKKTGLDMKSARNLSQREKNKLDRFAKGAGVRIVMRDSLYRADGKEANAYYLDGTVYISMQADEPYLVVAMHELTHHLKTVSPELYNAYEEYIMSNMDPDEFKAEFEALEDLYEISDVEYIMEEMACNYTEKLFGGGEEFYKLARENRGLAEKLLDLLRDLISRIRKAFHGETQTKEELQRLSEAERLWANMLHDGKQKESKGQQEAKYMLAPNLYNDFGKVLDNTFQSDKGEVDLGTTSDFLVDVIGAEQLTKSMPTQKAYAAMVSKEEAKKANRYDPKLNYHNMGQKGLYDALESAEHPIAAFVDTVDPNTGEDRSDRIVLITEEEDENGDLICVVDAVSTWGRVNNKNLDVNKTITAYGKKEIESNIRQAIQEKRILYIDKKRSHQMSVREGGQFANAITDDDLKNNIRRFWDNVNWKRLTKSQKEKAAHAGNGQFENSMAAALRKAGLLTEGGKQTGKERFSLKKPVEETKDLVALHNIDKENLLKTLKLGGFPMPSIAITKKNIPHTNFGEITVVMNKSAIDPEANAKNQVYSADAWTPTFPQIEYEANEKVSDKLQRKYSDLLREFGNENTRALYPWGNYAEDQLNREGGEAAVIEKYKDDIGMKKVYLLDNGKSVPEPVMKETVTRMSEEKIGQSEFLISALGESAVNELDKQTGETFIQARNRWFQKYEQDIKDAYAAYLREQGEPEDAIRTMVEYTNKADYMRMVKDTRNYLNHGAETVKAEEDTKATNQAIQDAVNQEDYETWLHGLFDGIEKQAGVSNNRERYTTSGNRRSFSETHLPVTLNNIVKSMASQKDGNTKNVSGFVGIKTLRAGMAKRFSGIAEMHELEGRLQHLSETEAKELNDALSDRMSDLIRGIYNKKQHNEYDNEYIEFDRIGEILCEVADGGKYTVDSIVKIFGKYQYKIGNSLAIEARNLLFDVSQMPVNMFEAKPERAIGFDEVVGAIVPSTAVDSELTAALSEAGIQVMEYDPNVEGDRTAKVNEVADAHEGAKFSLKKKKEFKKDKYFERKMDQWDELKQTSRIRVGEIIRGSALNQVGLPDSGLYFDVSKIQKSMEKHDDHLSASVLKRIPELLSDPIVITEYTGAKNTVNVYGDLFIGNVPVVVGIVMRIDASGQNIINNIRTIHARSDFAKQITDDTVLYLNEDKKRTRDWFQVCGNLNVPLNGTQSGFIRRITYENGKRNPSSEKSGQEKYSLKRFEKDGRRFVEVETDQAQFEGLSFKEMRYKARTIIKEKFQGKVIGIDNRAFVNGKTASEYGHTIRKMGEQEREAKMRASTELDNLLDAGTNFRTEPDGKDGHIHPDSVGDFQYFDTLFKVGEEYYEGVINIMPIKKGYLLHDITKIKNVTQSIHSSYGENPLARPIRDNSMVAQDTGKGNRKEESSEEKFSLKREKAYIEENKRLREMNEILEERLNRFGIPKNMGVNKKKVEEYAKELLAANGGKKLSRAELTRQLVDLYNQMGDGRVDDSDMKAEAQDIAIRIAESAVRINTEAYDEYRELIDTVKKTKIQLSERDRTELAYYYDGGYNAFRRAHMGKINLSAEGMTVDQFYAELAEDYPELFDSGISDPASELLEISRVLEDLKPFEENPNEPYMEQLVESLTLDILDEFWNIPDAKSADQKQAERYRAKIEALKEEGRKRNRETIHRERLRSEEKVKEIRDYYKIKELKRESSASIRTRKYQITKIANELKRKLMSPTEKKFVPEALRGPVAEFLGSLDFRTDRQGEETRIKLSELHDAYVKIASDMVSSESEAYMDVDAGFVHLIEKLANMVKDKPISELDAQEMETLYQITHGIKTAVNNYNKLLYEGKKEAVADVARDVRIELFKKKEKREHAYGFAKSLDKLFNLDSVNPEDFFLQLGPTMKRMYRNLRRAEDVKTRDLALIAEYTQRMLEDVDYDAWTGKKAKAQKFEVEGGTIEMTPAQVMSLYLLDKREQAQKHIYEGGIKLAPQVVMENGKKKIKKSYEPVFVTTGDVKRILSTMTKEQKQVAEKISQFLNTQTPDWGNEVSLRLYGFKKFGEPNYFPIQSDDNFLSSQFGFEFTPSIKNRGFTKPTVEHANNPIVVDDVFNVFFQSVDEMSSYHAYVIPLSDLQKVLNSKSDNGSVKQAIEKTFGAGGKKYIAKLIQDMNGSMVTDGGLDVVNWLLRNYKTAVMGFNLSVISQQPTALIRARYMIDGKYLAKGCLEKSDYEKVKRYAPIAQWKDWGYFTNNVGRQMRDVFMGKQTLNDYAFAGAQFMDNWAWGKLWNAVELEMKDKHPELATRSEAFYNACGERFSEIVDRTQVVDSVLHRSQAMRSGDTTAKIYTSFMSEPLKQYNLLRTVWMTYAQEKTKEARRDAIRATTSTLQSIVLCSAAAGIVGTLRHYHDDEDWLSQYLSEVKDNIIDNILGFVPVLSQVFSFARGYDNERMEMEGVAGMVKSIGRVADYISTGGDSAYTMWYLMRELSDGVAKVFGVPVVAVIKDFQATVDDVFAVSGWYEGQYAAEKTFYNIGHEKNRKRFMDILYRAYASGDMEAAQRIYADMLKHGMKKSVIQSGLKSRIRKTLDGTLEMEDMVGAVAKWQSTPEEERTEEMREELQAQFQEGYDGLMEVGYDEGEIQKAVKRNLTRVTKPQVKTPTLKEAYKVLKHYEENGDVESRDTFAEMYNALVDAGYTDDDLMAAFEAMGEE